MKTALIAAVLAGLASPALAAAPKDVSMELVAKLSAYHAACKDITPVLTERQFMRIAYVGIVEGGLSKAEIKQAERRAAVFIAGTKSVPEFCRLAYSVFRKVQ